MIDDFVTLTALVVSKAADDRDLLRRALSQAPVPFDLIEIDDHARAEPVCEALARTSIDIVLLDANMPESAREAVAQAARASPGRPFVMLVGAAASELPALAAKGMAFDGTLPRPVQAMGAQSMIAGCAQARMPSRVLIVDDSSTVRSVVRKVLQASRFNLETEEAAEGGAALARVAAEPFDIVFLDCNMPGLDGWDTLAQLQRTHPDIRVVMITGTNDAATHQRALAAGANELLYKPFYAKDIDAVMNRLFGLMPKGC